MAKYIRHLGIGTYCYPYMCGLDKTGEVLSVKNIFGLIDKAAEKGLKVIQIGDNAFLENMNEKNLVEIGEYSSRSGIALELGLRGLTQAMFLRYVYIAELVKAHFIRAVCDKGNFQPSSDELIVSLLDFVPILHEKNLQLGLETHDRFTADKFAEIIHNVGSERVGIVLDVTNSLANEERPLDVAKKLAPYTMNLHIKDYEICRRKEAMGLVIKGTPAGQGRLDISELIRIVRRDSPYSFNTILEFWMEPELTRENSIKKEECWVSQSLIFLSQFFKLEVS